jgi:hypothetical protein
LRDIEVGEAVAVVVTDNDTHSVGVAGDSGLRGDICECAVAIVPEQGVSKRRVGREEVAAATVDEIDVHPTIAIVVQERAASAYGFGEVHVGRAAVGVGPVDLAGGDRDLLEGWRIGGWSCGREEGRRSYGAERAVDAREAGYLEKMPAGKGLRRPAMFRHLPGVSVSECIG